MTKAAGLSLGRLTIVFAGFVIIVAGMKAAASIVVPLLCALFLMVLSLPVLHWLQRRKLPDGLALLLVIGGIVMMVVLVLLVLGSSFAGFQDDCAGYGERLQHVYGEAKEWLGGYVDVTDKLDSAIDPQVLMSYVGNAVGQLGGLMSNAFVILLLVAFLLAEANSFGKKLEAGSKDPAATRARLEKIGRGVTKYFSIKTAVSVLTGVLVGIVLAIAGVDYPVLWGFLAFLLNFVPSIGSILAAIPPVLLAIVQPELGAGTAVVVAVFLLAINLVVGTVLEPRFMGRGLDLSSPRRVLVAVVLELGARAGRHAAVGAIDRDGENHSRGVRRGAANRAPAGFARRTGLIRGGLGCLPKPHLHVLGPVYRSRPCRNAPFGLSCLRRQVPEWHGRASKPSIRNGFRSQVEATLGRCHCSCAEAQHFES